MAEPTVYFTYVTATWAVAGLHLTQAAADAEAAGDATLTALAGGLATVRDAAGDDVPAVLAEPDGIWSVYDGAPKVRQQVRNLTPLRTALGRRRELLQSLRTLLGRIGGDYPHADVAKGHNILYRLDQVGYLVGLDLVAAGDRSVANRIAWVTASALGPTDAGFDLARPETYFDIAHTVPEPTGPFSIVDLADFSRRTLADAIADPVAVGGAGEPAEPLPADLRGGAWLANVNA